MSRAWNNWFHITIHTYGTWLPGDPRGHRTRHHREHVEGDYRNPPPDTPERRALLERSRSLMPRPAVRIEPALREAVALAMRASLERRGVLLPIMCVDATHAHLLAKLPLEPESLPAETLRRLIGLAKKDASRALSDADEIPRGGLWGKRSRGEPVRDRSHQIAAYRYIERHARAGAFVLKSEA